MEQALATGPDTKTDDRAGESALQSTLQQIVDTTRSSKPEPLPVLIFLYGDYSSMDRSEANHFIDELLESSGIAFGVSRPRLPPVAQREFVIERSPSLSTTSHRSLEFGLWKASSVIFSLFGGWAGGIGPKESF